MKEKSNNREYMGTESIKTLIPKMAVPTIVAQLITTIYNLVDTYFVSTLGTNATAAVGVNSSLERVISLIGMLIGAGACSYIARLLGSGKDKNASEVMTISLLSGLLLGLVLTIFGVTFMTPMVNFLGATEECRQYSIEYATYVLLAAPFMTGSYILNMCLRSEGSATYSMIGMGFGGILNCFLDPLFIYGLGLGVAGASMATAISKTISFSILLYPYLRKRTVAQLGFRYIRFKLVYIKEVIAIGMSSFMRSLFGVVASILLNRVAGSYSTSALAALSVATRIMQFPFSFILGFGQGYQPVVGYNWGAKKIDRVKESFHFSIIVAAAGGAVMGMILFIFAEPIIRLFNSAADAEIMKYGVMAVRFECFALPVHACGTIVNMFYAGIGKARQALISSCARQGYCYIPVLFIAPRIFGITGLCATQTIADLITLVVFIPLFISANKLLKNSEMTKTG